MAAMRDFHRHAGIGQLDVDDSKMTKSTAQSHTHTLQIWKAGLELNADCWSFWVGYGGCQFQLQQCRQARPAVSWALARKSVPSAQQRWTRWVGLPCHPRRTDPASAYPRKIHVSPGMSGHAVD